MSRSGADGPADTSSQDGPWQAMEQAFFDAGDAPVEAIEPTQRVNGRLFGRTRRPRALWMLAACVLPLMSVGVWAAVAPRANTAAAGAPLATPAAVAHATPAAPPVAPAPEPIPVAPVPVAATGAPAAEVITTRPVRKKKLTRGKLKLKKGEARKPTRARAKLKRARL